MGRTTLTGKQVKDDSIELGVDTSGTLPLNEGGTGATDAANARTNLGTQAKHSATIGTSNADYITDGTADDVQIQQAIDALNAAGGGTLVFKKGTFTIAASITLYSKITLQGQGPGNSIIKAAGSWSSGDMFVIGGNGGTSSGSASAADTYSHINVFDLEFDANSLAHTPIALYAAGNVRVERCYIHDVTAVSGGYGVYVVNGSNIVVRNNRIGSIADRDAIQFKGVVGGWIMNNYVSGVTTLNAIDSHASDGTNGRSGSAIHVIDNTITDCNVGINIEENDSVILGNAISNLGNDAGIKLTSAPKRVLIAGNIISGDSTTNSIVGISLFNLTSGASDIAIANNIIADLSGSATSDGIFLATATGVTVTGNIVKNCGRYGVNNRCKNVVWDNNKFYDDQGSPTQDQGLFNDSGFSASIVGLETAQDTASGAGAVTTVRGQDSAAGTNLGAGEMRISTGVGTGNANNIISFYTANPTGSGTGVQSLTEKMRLFGSTNGILVLGATSATGPGTSDGFNMGGGVARSVQMNRHTTANTAGNSLTVASGGATSGATDKSAGALILQTGISTGSGASQIQFKTYTPSSGGGATNDNTLATRGTIDHNGYQGRIAPRTTTLTDGASVAVNSDTTDIGILSAAGNRTISAPTGTPVEGQKLMIYHTASGADRTLSLTTGSAGAFAFGTDITALTATTSGKTDYLGFIYNSTLQRWCLIAYAKGF